MQRFRWIALQGNSRGLLPPLLLFAFLITISGIPAHAADDSAACRFSVARIVSIQGTIELLRARQNDWSKVTRLDTALCEGDRLRTGALSRAALFIQPETLVRVDQNSSISVSQTADETLVEFTQEGMVATSAAAHTCGAGYFITRFPRKFRVNTPHLSAAVEGTEFLVAMRCESTDLSVFEGKVLAASVGVNVFPSQSVVSGQTLTVGGSDPPAIKLQLKPADAVQWTLYYPPITPTGAVPVEHCRVVAQDNRVSCLIARAEQLLRAGRVDEAQAIGDALAIAPYSSDAKALSSIISLVRNDKAEALRLAREAVEATPNSAPAWLALSYAQQADFKLEAALTSATRAAELTPSSALAFARVAELQLSLGWMREAEKTAQQAVAANPSESRAHMILGFVHLAQINVMEAREDFEHAIELDSTDPLSRLGLGLAIIRKGNLVEGREQIEIAVALDPTNSFIRSYVGKAYYEENTRERDELASIQFGLAKQVDPKDPTPWFYDAILKDSKNNPVAALNEIQTSIRLNDNRAVYRSKLLLDEDAASRSVNLARIYTQLGSEQLGILEASRSVAIDPSSYEAHRFLADTYLNVPRREIARTSELLQAQLLQPQNLLPVQPRLAFTEFDLASTTGPPRVGTNEFAPLFQRDGTRIFASAVGGNHNTWGDELTLAALKDPISLSLGQFHYETSGFRENNDMRHDAVDLFTQIVVSSNLNLQAEVISRRSQVGDINLNFDPNVFSLTDRRTFDQDSGRLGGRVRLCTQCDLLISVAYIDRAENDALAQPGVAIKDDSHGIGHQAEIEYLFRAPNYNVAAGGGAYRFKVNETSVVDFTSTFGEPCPVFIAPCDFSSTFDQNQDNGYVYVNVAPISPLLLTLGLSHDNYRTLGLKVRETNPKVGLQARLTDALTLRLASFQTVKRALPLEQTIEPTQIAGFNQFFDDANGTVSKFVNAGLDFRLSKHLVVGAEAYHRDIDFPIILLPASAVFEKQKEATYQGFILWTATPNSNVRVSLRKETFSRDAAISDDRPVSLSTLIVPVTINRFGSGGLIASVTASYVDQTVQRLPTSMLPAGKDNFTVVDASVGYRLPQRRGTVSLEVHNLLDAHFSYQDDSFRTSNQLAKSPFCPCQEILLRLLLNL